MKNIHKIYLKNTEKYGIMYAYNLYISIHGTGDSNGKGTAQPQLISSDKVDGQKRT